MATTINDFDNGGYHALLIEPKINTNVPIVDINELNMSSTPNSSSSSLNSQQDPPPVPEHGLKPNDSELNSTVLYPEDMSNQMFNSAPINQTYSVQQHYYDSQNFQSSDKDYLPESSVKMAILAGKKREARLRAPIDSKFPPVTVENINRLREKVKKTKNQDLMYFFARYLLLECTRQLKINPKNPDRMYQLKQSFNEEGLKIMKKLASHRSGYGDAILFLGNGYGHGLYGLKKDSDKAFGYYTQGSKVNHPECTYRTALCYEKGVGTRKDHKFALQFYRKAANLSNPSALNRMGLILLHGLLGQSRNPREAISWFVKASQNANEEHPESLHQLGLAYEKSDIPSIIPDLNYAHELFSQAAVLGYAPSQYKLGLAYETSLLNCPIDPKRSIAWYSRAAEQNHPDAALGLSGWYFTGVQGVLEQNDKEAYLWAKKAASQGSCKAEYAVGYYIETGIGVSKNIELAKEWYKKASNHGSKDAKQRLIELKTKRAKLKRRPTRDRHGKPDSKDAECIIM